MFLRACTLGFIDYAGCVVSTVGRTYMYDWGILQLIADFVSAWPADSLLFYYLQQDCGTSVNSDSCCSDSSCGQCLSNATSTSPVDFNVC